MNSDYKESTAQLEYVDFLPSDAEIPAIEEQKGQ